MFLLELLHFNAALYVVLCPTQSPRNLSTYGQRGRCAGHMTSACAIFVRGLVLLAFVCAWIVGRTARTRTARTRTQDESQGVSELQARV